MKSKDDIFEKVQEYDVEFIRLWFTDINGILRRALEKMEKLGFDHYVGPELEYFYFKSSIKPEPLDSGGYFDQNPLDMATNLRRETVLSLKKLGINVEYSHHEAASSQHEIDM